MILLNSKNWTEVNAVLSDLGEASPIKEKRQKDIPLLLMD
jgi:hypothetical protein